MAASAPQLKTTASLAQLMRRITQVVFGIRRGNHKLFARFNLIFPLDAKH